MDGFKKDDRAKNMLGCLPPRALLAVGRVLTHGALKYGRDNWHKVPSRSRYYDAALRHLLTWWSGEDWDTDTGESHLAHAVCCLMFLLELEQAGILSVRDDRMHMRPSPETRSADHAVIIDVSSLGGALQAIGYLGMEGLVMPAHMAFRKS